MKNRIDIIAVIKTALQRIDGGTSPWDRDYSFANDLHGDVTYGYNEDINSFPTISIIILNESVYSIGGGVRYSNLQIELRCYTYDEDTEFSAEAIASDAEHVFSQYRRWASDIEDLRIAEIETDGGINAPYGAAIIKAQVLFKR